VIGPDVLVKLPDEAEPLVEPARSIVVAIKASNNWRETCREVVKTAGQYHGNDSLHIRVAGHTLAMEFPNQNTDFCQELSESLQRLSSVLSVNVS
jgi:hypothetical protein